MNYEYNLPYILGLNVLGPITGSKEVFKQPELLVNFRSNSHLAG